MNNILLVFIGGGVGSLARYGIGKMLASWANFFPVGTLVANVLACFILGIVTGWAALRPGESANMYRMLIGTGFCGGFSTFSTFSNETVLLMQNNRWIEAMLNVLISLVSCLLFTVAGMWAGKQFAPF